MTKMCVIKTIRKKRVLLTSNSFMINVFTIVIFASFFYTTLAVCPAG